MENSCKKQLTSVDLRFEKILSLQGKKQTKQKRIVLDTNKKDYWKKE